MHKQANKKAVPSAIRLECHNNDPVSNWPIDSEWEYNKTGADFTYEVNMLSFLYSV